VDTASWVRHIVGDQFQVFAINCAHLGCPVRWFAQSPFWKKTKVISSREFITLIAPHLLP
jgi:hypothetical protein